MQFFLEFHQDLAFNGIWWQCIPQVNYALYRKFLRSLFHFLLSCLCITHTSHEGGQEVPNLPYITPVIFYTSVLFIFPPDCPMLHKPAMVFSNTGVVCITDNSWCFSLSHFISALFFLRSYSWQGLPADLHDDKTYVNLSPTLASPFVCCPIFN